MKIDRVPCYTKGVCGSVDGSIKPLGNFTSGAIRMYGVCGSVDGSVKPLIRLEPVLSEKEPEMIPDLPKPVKIAFIPLIVFLFILYLVFKK